MINYSDTTQQFAVKYNEALSLLEVVWYRCISKEALPEVIADVNEVLCTKQVKLFISNVKCSNSTRLTEELWLINYCFPLLENTGISRLARIADTNTLGQMVVSKILEVKNSEEQFGFNVQSFSSRDQALDWLLSA